MIPTTVIASEARLISTQHDDDLNLDTWKFSENLPDTNDIYKVFNVHGKDFLTFVQKNNMDYAIILISDDIHTEVLTSSSEFYDIGQLTAGHVLVSSAIGYYESGDSGRTFELINDTSLDHRSICVCANYVFGHNGTHIYLSDDTAISFDLMFDVMQQSTIPKTDPTPAIAGNILHLIAGFGNLLYECTDFTTWTLKYQFEDNEQIMQVSRFQDSIDVTKTNFLVKIRSGYDELLNVPIYKTYLFESGSNIPQLQYYQSIEGPIPDLSSITVKTTGTTGFSSHIVDVSHNYETDESKMKRSLDGKVWDTTKWGQHDSVD